MRDESPDHPILTADQVPDLVERTLYASITSANSLPAILDALFDLGLGLLDDKVDTHDDGGFNYQEVPRR